MRKSPRVSINLPVAVDCCGSTYEGRITDLGLNGAFIAMPPSLKIPAVANLRFLLSPTAIDKVLGRVIHAEPEGVGMEFLDLDSHSHSTLWDFLVPLLPGEIEECPFCGQATKYAHFKVCQKCHLSLDFHRKDYYQFLVAQAEQESQEMIGVCDAMRQVFHLIRKVATTDVPVLITGDPGTGKELVARAIHERSQRGEGPFVAINCGAIPRELLESELFGHEKGAFTGAHRTAKGIVEQAEGGTLFLDEIGELPLELQVKLLRFLQEYTFARVGGRKTKQADLRVLSATNSDLPEMIAIGRFREDLYYRLDVISIGLPPLKDREDDALIMANVFMKRYASMLGKDIRGFGRDVTTAIQTHTWPGNVRELMNRVRRGVVMAEGPWITAQDMGLKVKSSQPVGIFNGKSLKEAKAEFEAQLLTEALKLHQGKVYQASQALSISRSLMYQLIQKYDLKRYTVSPIPDNFPYSNSQPVTPLATAPRKTKKH
jgi:two-component system NtrC family response regulator